MLGSVRRWVLLGVSVTWLFSVAAGSQTNEFEASIREFELADRHTPPPARPILFVGSSTFRDWTNLAAAFPEWPVINRGFGGSTMADVLRFYPRVVKAYSPRVILVYEGDNDLDRGTSGTVVLGQFREFLDRVRQDFPGTGVVLLAVKPSPRRLHLIEAQRQLNAGLLRLATERARVIYVDTFSPMLGPDGGPDPRWFQDDDLHLNAEGYQRWEPQVRSAIRQAVPEVFPANSQ